jgi:DNA-binding NtrC family response regulator
MERMLERINEMLGKRIGNNRKFVILVAGWEVLIRNLVTILLQAAGYIVLAAADGLEGLELSRNYPGAIDLVITDMLIPRLNGMDPLGRLLMERSGIKTIVMSEAVTSEVISQNSNLHFLPIPFDDKALLKRVATILGAPPLQQSKDKLVPHYPTRLFLFHVQHVKQLQRTEPANQGPPQRAGAVE